jgi:hypothetical protein
MTQTTLAAEREKNGFPQCRQSRIAGAGVTP